MWVRVCGLWVQQLGCGWATVRDTRRSPARMQRIYAILRCAVTGQLATLRHISTSLSSSGFGFARQLFAACIVQL
ncbi:hypothetical protein BJV74DRAFT_858886 [Russula compacta]|nr:hypothetical protein BJV74DRAFT_858886 [Russula compacta]